jgi:ribose transport system permease protein
MGRILGVTGLLFLLYALLIASNPAAGERANLFDVANIQGRYGVLTLGAALVIVTGGIDLSVGSVVGCAAVLFGVLTEAGVHPDLAAVLVVAAGGCVGLGNGLLVTLLRLQPFLVTLCGMFVYRGAARMLGGVVSRTRTGEAQPTFVEPLQTLRGVLIGKDAGGELVFPMQFVALLLLAAVVGFFLHRTAHGRYWYAIGHNEQAARYAGVPVGRQRVMVYVACSALAALAGVLLFLDTPSVQSDSGGMNLELYAILGAVLGGCSLRGGEGTAYGMVLGAMVLPVLENLVGLRGMKSDVIPAVIGLTLLAGTLFDELTRRGQHARAWHAVSGLFVRRR